MSGGHRALELVTRNPGQIFPAETIELSRLPSPQLHFFTPRLHGNPCGSFSLFHASFSKLPLSDGCKSDKRDTLLCHLFYF